METASINLLSMFSYLNQYSTLAFALALGVMLTQHIRKDGGRGRACTWALGASICVFVGELAALAAANFYRPSMSPSSAVWFVIAKSVYTLGLCFGLYAVFLAVVPAKRDAGP